MVFDIIWPKLAKILFQSFHPIEKAVPPANIVPQVAVHIEIKKSAYMAIARCARRHTRDDVVIVHKSKRLRFEIGVKRAGEISVADAWLTECVKTILITPESQPALAGGGAWAWSSLR